LKGKGKLRLAAVQMQSGNDWRANLERALARVTEAAEAGADVVALPENFVCMGSEGDRARIARESEGEVSRTLQSVARARGVILLGGSFLVPSGEAEDPRPCNTSVLWDRSGGVAAVYHKIHLFDVSIHDGSTYQESRHVRPGSRIVTVGLEGVTFGLSICYDLRFPELYRALTLEGAQIVFVPSAFTLATGKEHWLPLLQARAIENQFYLVAPAQFGVHPDKRQTYGHSAILDPWGMILAQAPERECVIYAEFDPEYLAEVRSRIPVLRHRRPDLYSQAPGKKV